MLFKNSGIFKNKSKVIDENCASFSNENCGEELCHSCENKNAEKVLEIKVLDINDNGPLVQQQDTDFIVKAGAGKDVNIAQQIRSFEINNKILNIIF